MSTVRSLRDSEDVDKRAILIDVEGNVPTANPVASTVGVNAQGASFLHFYAELGGTLSEVKMTPWYFSTIAEQWFEGDQITFLKTPDTLFAIVQTEGEERLFLVVDSVVGAGTFKIWAGASYPHPGRDY